ncbi:hypothetical protein INT44_004975 [Umbelopsis vinacea]|uniref:Cytochrome P450 n=1 Tax=Umbelopsis vinacea TaxID=44442 RepID=A0A8H7Q8I9_9FUNG|nr:hypothetical protein INT44_004975 [Umbelopsis vinacea]
MSSLKVLLNDAEKHFGKLSSFYVHHIIPYVKRRSPHTYIAAAVVAFLSYQVYNAVRVPRNLRHIPAVPYWKYMKSALSGEGIDVRAQKVILPVLAKSPNGIYLRPNEFGWTVAIASPAAMKTLFLRTDDYPKHSSFNKNMESLAVRFGGAENIAILNGSVWKKHRTIANPAFHRSMPVRMFGKQCEKMMVAFEKEGDGLVNVDVPKLLQRFTLDVIGLAAFDYNFEALDNPNNEKVTMYNEIIKGTQNPVYFFFPILEKYFLWAFPKRKALHRKMDEMNTIFFSIIDRKRKTLASNKNNIEEVDKDLLTLMLEANEDTENPQHQLSDAELRDNLAVFFLAGHDTTSNTLCFALYYLAANQHVQEKAREEALRILGDGDDIVYPSAQQCSDMKYIYMVMKETLRMDGPAQNTIPRQSSRDTELAGTFIPNGTSLIADMFVMHHDPSVWKDPEAFVPERFAPGGESESKAGQGLSWAPFGSGSRQCIGMNFSLAEQKVALSMLLRKFTWTLPDNSTIKEHIVIGGGVGIIYPEELHLKFTKRF